MLTLLFFFESSDFKITDINSDGENELLIEIEPFESTNSVWIYELNANCSFNFINSKNIDSYEITNGELVVRSNAVCEYWDECLDFESIFGRVDYSRLYRLDFYQLKGSKLINNNIAHKKEIDNRIADYKIVVEQLKKLKSDAEFEWKKVEILRMSDRLSQTIEDY